MSRVGDLLRAARAKSGLSQSEVGDRLGYGSAQFISNIERGVASLPAEKIMPISRLFKLDVDVIIDAKADDEKAMLRAAVKGGDKKKRVS